MAKHRLYRFSKQLREDEVIDIDGEFVIISDLPEQEIIDEYTHSQASLDEVLDIDGDATSFPCNRALRDRPAW